MAGSLVTNKRKVSLLAGPLPLRALCAHSALASGEAAGAPRGWSPVQPGPWRWALSPSQWLRTPTYLLVEALPAVLRHQSEEGEEGPGEGVEAGVAVVRVLACLQAPVALGTCPVARHTDSVPCCEGASVPETLVPHSGVLPS